MEAERENRSPLAQLCFLFMGWLRCGAGLSHCGGWGYSLPWLSTSLPATGGGLGGGVPITQRGKNPKVI